MTSDKLAEALQRLIKANPAAMNSVQVDAAMEARKALAAHETKKQEPELIDLVKELQASLIDATALIDELQQKPDRLDAERYRFLRNDFSAASLDIDGNHSWVYRRNFSLLGASMDEAIDKAKEVK